MLSQLTDPTAAPDPADDVALRRIVALFADAAAHADAEAFAALWTDDGRWTIAPPIGADFQGRDAIGDGFAGLMRSWEFLLQAPLNGVLAVDGDAATGRWLVRETGRMADGRSQHNHAFYADRYVRTDGGWRFARRDYRFLLLDDAPVAGTYTAPS